MRFLSKRTSSLNSRQGSPSSGLSAGRAPLLTVAHLFLFIVMSLCLSRDALSRLWGFDNPHTKAFFPPFPLHPPSFPLPPTTTVTQGIKPARKSQSWYFSTSLLVCLAVASVFARLSQNEPKVQREPAVNSGRGTEEPWDITTPTPDDDSKSSSSDGSEAPRKPAACSGRGIKESLDGDNHNDPPILLYADDSVGTGINNLRTIKDAFGFALMCAVAAAERMRNNRLHVLAKHIRLQAQCAAERTASESTAPKGRREANHNDTEEIKEKIERSIEERRETDGGETKDNMESFDEVERERCIEVEKPEEFEVIVEDGKKGETVQVGVLEGEGEQGVTEIEMIELTDNAEENNDEEVRGEGTEKIEVTGEAEAEEVEVEAQVEEGTCPEEFEVTVEDGDKGETVQVGVLEGEGEKGVTEIEKIEVTEKAEENDDKEVRGEGTEKIEEVAGEAGAEEVEVEAQAEEGTCKAEAEQIMEIEESEEAATHRRMAMWEAEAMAMAEKSKNIPAAKPRKFSWGDDWDNAEDDNDDSGDWFTVSRGKTVKTSSQVSSSPAPCPTTTKSDAVVGPTVTSPTDTDKGLSSGPTSSVAVAEASTSDAHTARVSSSWSKEPEWRAEKMPAFPPEPQPPQPPRQRYKIVPANEPNWLEARAERYKKEMEAWEAFKEAKRAAERARIEEEESKAREIEEAKAARIGQFDTAMSRIDVLLKAAKEEREKWEKEKEENEKALKKIDLAQGKIGELVDFSKVRDLFDPEVLGSSSLFSATQLRIPPGHRISDPSSSSSAAEEATTLPDSERPDTSSSSSAVTETTSVPDMKVSEPSSSNSDIVAVTALPGSENVEPSFEVSTVVEETAPPSLENSKAPSSSAVPMSYALAVQANSTPFQSNAAERSAPPQTMTDEERKKARQNKATEERRKRRKKAHARWLAQQAEAEQAEAAQDGGESGGSSEAR